ncbi:hypothetical protein [Deinococcus ruber]|nr:hypothetical protein [Deinococcus ruber]
MLPLAFRPLLALLLLLAGCAPSFQNAAVQPSFSGPLTPRPEGSPDVLILAMSGRCPCLSAPINNVDYLMPRGTVKAVAAAFEAQGLSVQSAGAAAHLTSHLPTTAIQSQLGKGVTVAPPQDGFLQMEARLVAAQRDWIVGRSNPTRIVLLAHSHGVVWTHALARAHPEVPISLMIDLDGVCDMWESDNRRLIQAYVQQLGHNPWPFDLSNSCASVRVGHVRYDLKDVVYPNVTLDLEVQSQRLVKVAGGFQANFPFDALTNVRPDGSHTGIQTFRSQDTHSNVSMPGGEALVWIKDKLSEVVAGWRNAPSATDQNTP